MITKRAFIEQAAVLGALHASQNKVMELLANKSPQFHEKLLTSLVHGDTGLGAKEALKEGFITGVVPEAKILQNEAVHLGKGIKENVVPLMNEKLSIRDIAYIRRFLRTGDAGYLSQVHFVPGMLNDFIAVLPEEYRNLIYAYNNGAIPEEAKIKFVSALGDAFSKNDFFGPVGKGMAKQMSAKALYAPKAVDSVLPNLAPISEVATNIALGAADAAAPVMNAAKRYMASGHTKALAEYGKTLDNPILKETTQLPDKVVRKVGDMFVTSPFYRAMENGLSGAGVHPVLGEDLGHNLYNYGSNFLTENINTLVNRIGAAVRNSGVVPPDVLTAAAKLSRAQRAGESPELIAVFTRDLQKAIEAGKQRVRFTADPSMYHKQTDVFGGAGKRVQDIVNEQAAEGHSYIRPKRPSTYVKPSKPHVKDTTPLNNMESYGPVSERIRKIMERQGN